jgi:hypothetical protein
MSSSIWTDHFPLLFLHATILSSFLSLLWRERPRERWQLFGGLLGSLVGGALLVAWLLAAVAGR